MFLKGIEMTNWKCYSKKTRFEFEMFELINRRNGTGKTSLFEAIIFAIWGKTPPGFNLNTVRYDASKQSVITVWFESTIEHLPREIKIVRKFYPSSAELYIDGDLRFESVRAIDEYMNSLMDFKIVSQFWTNSLIESNLSSSSYFTNTLLQSILEDPISIQAELKRRIYQNNRTIGAFRSEKEFEDIDGIKKEMDSLQSRLRQNIPVDISKARSAANAAQKAKELNPFILDDFKNLNLSDAQGLYMRWRSAYDALGQNRAKLSKELQKQVSSYSKYNLNVVKMMLDYSDKNCRCALCHQDISHECVISLQNELANAGRSEDTINQLQDAIAFATKYHPDIMEKLKQWISYISIINSCPNYAELIQAYDAENSENWQKFELLQGKYAKALIQKEKANEIQKLKVENQQFSEKLEVISKWIQDTSTYYMQNILAKASEYLRSINCRYQQIYDYEGGFHVLVESEDGVLNLIPVVRLSNGEKTICSLSLLFAIHAIMLPDLPLLFDETFAALDHENLHSIQSFLRTVKDTQIFVITHDMSWKEL